METSAADSGGVWLPDVCSTIRPKKTANCVPVPLSGCCRKAGEDTTAVPVTHDTLVGTTKPSEPSGTSSASAYKPTDDVLVKMRLFFPKDACSLHTLKSHYEWGLKP